jgi:2-polyprenyl-6-methoxyphenol hydroxylase-like FAD-dependent oxidoreductase
MLPHAQWIETGAKRIAGKVELTDENRALIDPIFLTKTLGIRSSKRFSLFVMAHDGESREGLPDGIATNDDAAKLCPGLLFDNTKSFVMWSLSGRSDRIPNMAAKLADPAEQKALMDFTMEALADWHPAVREFVGLTDPTTVGVMPIKTMLPVDPWPTRQITLMGDAIHGMTYFRALGANSALHDANLLRAELVRARDGEKPLIAALAGYEAAMREVGYAAMMASLRTYELHHGELDPQILRPVAAA